MVSSSEKIVFCVILCCALSGAVFGETGDDVTQEPVGVRNDLIEGLLSSNESSGSIDFRRVILEIPLNFPEGRTFGHHFLKRISFAIIPAAFVVGVITTLLAALTVVSIKGLGVGVSAIHKVNGCRQYPKNIILQVILLVIAFGQILARTFSSAPLPQYNAPLPIVYQRQAADAPIWFEKDWTR